MYTWYGFLAGLLLMFCLLYPSLYTAEQYAEEAMQYIWQVEAERDTYKEQAEGCRG